MTTARRAIAWIAADAARLEALRAARALARALAWKLGARPARVVIEIDATLLAAYSEKEGAAGTFRHGFGHHPMNAYLDGSREALAALLPGNAGSNTAADQIAVVDLALEQLPRKVVAAVPILRRAAGAGAVHALVDYLREERINFSVGFDLTAEVRQAIIDLPEDAWQLAVCQDGKPRVKPGDDGEPVELAHVAELTGLVGLDGWPPGSRLIARRERLAGEQQPLPPPARRRGGPHQRTQRTRLADRHHQPTGMKLRCGKFWPGVEARAYRDRGFLGDA